MVKILQCGLVTELRVQSLAGLSSGSDEYIVDIIGGSGIPIAEVRVPSGQDLEVITRKQVLPFPAGGKLSARIHESGDAAVYIPGEESNALPVASLAEALG